MKLGKMVKIQGDELKMIWAHSMLSNIRLILLSFVSPILLLSPFITFALLLTSPVHAQNQSDTAEAKRLMEQVAELNRQGRYSEAIPLAEKVLDILEKALGPDDLYVANILNNLAFLYDAQGQYDRAELLYQRSLRIFEKKRSLDHPDVATSLNNLAELYRKQGKYIKAEPLYLRSVEIRKQILGLDNADYATSLGNLGALYVLQGQYVKAEPLLQSSIEILEKSPRSNDLVNSLNNLAELYRQQGKYIKAEPLYKRSVEIIEKVHGPDHTSFALSLSNLAELYRNEGQYQKAEPLYQRSLAIVEKALGLAHPSVSTITNNLAELYRQQGQYEKAEPLYQRSLDIYEKQLGPSHPFVSTSINNLAALYSLQGKYQEAEPLYQRSLEIIEKALGPNHPLAINTLNNLGFLYQSQNDIQRAVRFLSRGLDIQETLLFQNLILGTEQDKQSFLNLFSGESNHIISLHLQDSPNNLDSEKLAFTTILRRKGRVLEAQSNSFSVLQQNLPPVLQQQLQELKNIFAQQSDWASRIKFDPVERQQTLKTLEARAEKLEENLKRNSIEFRKITQSATIAEVQAAIPNDAALIEFIQYKPFNPKAKPEQRFGNAHYAAYILQSSGETRWVDLGDAQTIDALIVGSGNCTEETLPLRCLLKDPSVETEKLKERARQLDAKLMEPVRKLLQGKVTHLLIAPDAQLNLLPFAALVDEQNKFLLETYQITYLTTGRDLLRQPISTKANAPLILANPTYSLKTTKNLDKPAQVSQNSEFSNDLASLVVSDLPATNSEAKAIQPLLKDRQVYLQKQATEEVIKQHPNPKILHIATHGFFLPPGPTRPLRNDLNRPLSILNQRPEIPIENPLLRSGLALAGFNDRHSTTEDGVLTALEVTGLDLKATQLVVLSACETGLGDVAQGEGIYGLRRAFTLAGAQSQVTSLWKVPDSSTKDFMVAYYTKLNQGVGRGEALRQVQLAMLNGQLKDKTGTFYTKPYVWAAFIPTGDWRPLQP